MLQDVFLFDIKENPIISFLAEAKHYDAKSK